MTLQAAEKPGFVTRARLQSGRKCNGINVGFSPCGKPLGFFGQMLAFFRSLFSRAASAMESMWALAPAGNAHDSHDFQGR
jgi:hypothetical protein